MYTNILFFTTTLEIIVLGNVQKHEIITVIHVPTGQVSASTFHLSMLENGVMQTCVVQSYVR